MGDTAIWHERGRQTSGRGARTETPCTQAIASAVYARLPLELRNRIYGFCVQGSYDNEVIVRRSPNRCHAFDLLVRESSGPHSYLWVEDQTASYMSAERMPADTAREMLEAYYWTRVFKFAHRELDLLAPFLESDVFGLGRIPVRCARRLHLQMRPLAGASAHSPKRAMAELHKCRQAIAALAAIRSARTEVVVHFDLHEHLSDCTNHAHFAAEDAKLLLQLIRDLIALKERGLRIEIAFSGTWTEHSSTRIRSTSICSPEECMLRMTKAARHVRLREPA